MKTGTDDIVFAVAIVTMAILMAFLIMIAMGTHLDLDTIFNDLSWFEDLIGD